MARRFRRSYQSLGVVMILAPVAAGVPGWLLQKISGDPFGLGCPLHIGISEILWGLLDLPSKFRIIRNNL